MFVDKLTKKIFNQKFRKNVQYLDENWNKISLQSYVQKKNFFLFPKDKKSGYPTMPGAMDSLYGKKVFFCFVWKNVP